MTNKKIPPENLLDPQQNSTLDGLLEMVIPKSKDGKMPGVNEIGFHEFIIDFNAESDEDTIINLTNHNYWNFLLFIIRD